MAGYESGGRTAILLMKCPDHKGLVREIADFVSSHGGNILHADNHLDYETREFFARFEWELEDFSIPAAAIAGTFQPIADKYSMEWQLRFSNEKPAVAIFVSKLAHCLLDLLHRWEIGEMPGSVAAVISNHDDLKSAVERRGVPFYHFAITPQNKRTQELQQLELLKSLNVELLILARYLQVFTDDFIAQYQGRSINIHHSFLPAFVGSSPYARAYERGVKLVGATSHYVTPHLDSGPIIEQDVARVTHRDTLADFIRKGRDLERVVLARAVRLHLEGRVLAYANKTVVFD
ncbi:MAG TPA: formyltetrahydrofolate deformylase [Candidatus Binataceae bacterium]|jgi:formyltetrahydrofolate deformylase|nr:formyltetrahydrofolate deformylase [Candidatus Binataceae bacterium]